MDKLSQNKIVRKIIRNVKSNMTDEQVIELLLQKSISNKTPKKLTTGQKAADNLAKFAGSWTFILVFMGILVAWVITNIILATRAFDPYPFILLNLGLSCIAAIQSPIIMMSQNRQAEKDREQSDEDYKVNVRNAVVIKDLYEKIGKINKLQYSICKALEKQGLLAKSDYQKRFKKKKPQTQNTQSVKNVDNVAELKNTQIDVVDTNNSTITDSNTKTPKSTSNDKK